MGQCDFGRPTDRISELRRPRQAYAYAQTHKSLRCSHTENMDVAEGSDQNVDL